MSANAITNAANARLSTGPITAEGKARSSRNATKHGLTSGKTVLPHENQEEFNELQQEFQNQYQPANLVELEFLTTMVAAWWKLRRCHRIEAEFLNHRIEAILEAGEGTLTPDAAMARIFADPQESRQFTILQRYITSTSREFQTAKKQLEAAQRARQEKAETEVPATAEPPARPDGFVSQNASRPIHEPSTTPQPTTRPTANQPGDDDTRPRWVPPSYRKAA